MRSGLTTDDSLVWPEKDGAVLLASLGPGAPSLLDAVSRSAALPPELSSRLGLSRAQWEFCGGLVFASGCCLVLSIHVLYLTLYVGLWGLFSLTVVWRLLLTVFGGAARLSNLSSGDVVRVPDELLPVYSVLIALRDEAAMMRQLAANLSRLDWPADKLEIILLIEEDDTATYSAAARADFPKGTLLLKVPPGNPMTKPRALNYGLAHARGRYITVYDAEDRPDLGQLRAAHEAFCVGPEHLMCVQAPLVASNGEKAWLSAQWALEYDVQFRLHMPVMAKMRLPIMLGGTSNHFRRESLLMAGGWDAWNVTEDADLGLRLARLAGTTQTINNPTLEAAPTRTKIWLAQRSRWIKGFLQTWLVCWRAPIQLLRELGPVRWLSLQLTLGGALASAALNGPMTMLVAISLIAPGWTLSTSDLLLFISGWLTCGLADLLAPGRWSLMRILAVVTRPLYWPLHMIAAGKAVYGLAVRPFFWAKTPHQPDDTLDDVTCSTGLSRQS